MKAERDAWLARQVAQVKICDPDDVAGALRDAAALQPAGAKLALAIALDDTPVPLAPLAPLWDVQQNIEQPATRDRLIRATRTTAAVETESEPALEKSPVAAKAKKA